MSLVIDIAIILFIVVMALLAAKKGFVCSLVEVVGFLVAIVATVLLSLPISNFISELFSVPAAAKWISVPVSIVLLAILCIVVKIVAKIINGIFSFSIVGRINRLLGGILGAIKGISFSIAFCFILYLILSFSKNGFLFFTPEVIEKSYVFKFFMGFTPFL